MALEGTHIRFAVEFKEALGVKNIGDYVAGCLYPDSRYKTGVERALTHPADFLSWDLAQVDDFKKGWYTHLLCDQAQGKVFREKLPQLFIPGEAQAGNATWIGLTAIKLLQDIDDIRHFGVASFLPADDHIRGFNNEDPSLLRSCYRTVRAFYSDPSNITIGNYGEKLTTLGLEKEYASRVITKAKEFSANEGIMAVVRSIFSETIAKAQASNI